MARNRGKLEFEHHHIAMMPGVHCAKAADFDGDGDLDIVACAFMQPIATAVDYDSIVFLRNDGNQQFEKSWIEKTIRCIRILKSETLMEMAKSILQRAPHR